MDRFLLRAEQVLGCAQGWGGGEVHPGTKGDPGLSSRQGLKPPVFTWGPKRPHLRECRWWGDMETTGLQSSEGDNVHPSEGQSGTVLFPQCGPWPPSSISWEQGRNEKSQAPPQAH